MPRPSFKLTGVFVGVLAAGLLIGWILQSDSSESGVATQGEPAPDFTVELIDGGDYTLSDSVGRKVVINFWASWCGPCREEIPAISIYAEANPEVDVIGVAVEDVEEASRQFADEIETTFPLALGTDEVEESYPRLGLPATYIIDEDGNVARVWNGIVDQFVLDDLVSSS